MIHATLLLASLLRAPVAPADTGFTPTIVLVRHAEKASDTDRDPSLSDLGKLRAAALDSVLMHSHVTAIIVTQYKRTAETAALVAARHHLQPLVLTVDPANIDAHIAAVARAAREHDGVVLVVGHSNTVARITRALGGPAIADLCDANYASLFVVSGTAMAANVMRSRYGAAEPPMADVCPGTPR